MKCNHNESNLNMIQLDPYSGNTGNANSGNLFNLVKQHWFDSISSQ